MADLQWTPDEPLHRAQTETEASCAVCGRGLEWELEDPATRLVVGERFVCAEHGGSLVVDQAAASHRDLFSVW